MRAWVRSPGGEVNDQGWSEANEPEGFRCVWLLGGEGLCLAVSGHIRIELSPDEVAQIAARMIPSI